MKSYFVHNGSVALHVLENRAAGHQKPSLLVIGGLWEPAERAMPVLSGISGHGVAFSFRGRGLSSTPDHGYDLDDHLSDIDTVVRHCGLRDYCVLGFSRGASYALGWALRNRESVRGLILVDQPPEHQKPGQGYVEFWSNLIYGGVPILNFMRRAALEGLERDATYVDFSPQLAGLSMPVALFAGQNQKAAIPSDLTADAIQTYTRALPSCEVIGFSQSGHMIPDEEKEKYVAEIEGFLGRVQALPSNVSS